MNLRVWYTYIDLQYEQEEKKVAKRSLVGEHDGGEFSQRALGRDMWVAIHAGTHTSPAQGIDTHPMSTHSPPICSLLTPGCPFDRYEDAVKSGMWALSSVSRIYQR